MLVWVLGEGVAAELVAEFEVGEFDFGDLAGVEGVAPVLFLGNPVEASVGEAVVFCAAFVEGMEGEVVVEAVVLVCE